MFQADNVDKLVWPWQQFTDKAQERTDQLSAERQRVAAAWAALTTVSSVDDTFDDDEPVAVLGVSNIVPVGSQFVGSADAPLPVVLAAWPGSPSAPALSVVDIVSGNAVSKPAPVCRGRSSCRPSPPQSPPATVSPKRPHSSVSPSPASRRAQELVAVDAESKDGSCEEDGGPVPSFGNPVERHSMDMLNIQRRTRGEDGRVMKPVAPSVAWREHA